MKLKNIKFTKYWIPFIGFFLFHAQDAGPKSITDKGIHLFANWHACWWAIGLPIIIALIILL